jgi:radical SAM superfamily enzyme YgiQ (UPF0313 family)
MKILFIYKNEFIEPLGIMSLSAYLKKYGHECHFIDIQFEKNLEGGVRRISPGVIAYSVMTGKHKYYQDLNARLKKEFSFFSVFGGPHCTFFPDFINEDGVDAICRGEGEAAFLELVDGLENSRDITNIKNLWIKSGSKVYKNTLRDLVEDLDSLPFPDRELINKYAHYYLMPRRGVMTGRGCPYACTYCFNHSYNSLYRGKGSVIRRRSVGNVIEELKRLKKTYNSRRFHFWDDTFNLNREWVVDFCSVYKKEVGLPFIVNVRMNLVEDESMKALKDAGCITVCTAIESGDEHIRNKILKRNISEQQILDACSIFRKHGLKIYIGNMIGLPDETLDISFKTVELNAKCRPSYSNVSIYMPYPGTELCDYSRQKGYFSGEFDSIEWSTNSRSSMHIKDVKKVNRLHHLFSLGVTFPFLIPLIRVLVGIPLTRLYYLWFHCHRAWCYFFKVRYIDLFELLIRE